MKPVDVQCLLNTLVDGYEEKIQAVLQKAKSH